jgi:WD40 repeat protein
MEMRIEDRIIVTGGEDLSIKIWRINEPEKLKIETETVETFKSLGGPPFCISVFGNNIAYGSRNGLVSCAFFDKDWKLVKHEQLKGDIFEDTLCCAFKDNKLYTGHSGS